MKTEIMYLVWVTTLTALIWVPYIVDRILVWGVADAVGYPDNPTRAFFGLVAPAGTPKPIVQRIRDEIAAVVGDPAFRDKNMIQRGLEPAVDSPEAFARFLSQYRAASARVVQEAGLEPQ